MNHTRIKISEEKRYQLVTLLNQVLADMADLISQAKYAHWNIRGRDFYNYHKLFEEVYQPIEAAEDDLAERITTLGGAAMGTVRASAHHSRLKEIGHNEFDSEFLLTELIERFATFANGTRDAIGKAESLGDAVTADMLTELSTLADKSLWLLEANSR